MNTLSKRLTETIQLKNLTQNDLASLLGVKQATVSRWCTGQREPNLDTLLLICNTLDESADYLIGLHD